MWSALISQPVVVDGIFKKGPNGDWSVFVTEVRFINAVHHKAISLGVGRSVENSRELRPSQLVSILGFTVLPSVQRAAEKE